MSEFNKPTKLIAPKSSQEFYDDLQNKVIDEVITRFETWTHENLAKFAAESYAKMQKQQDHIEQLQNDLKDAIKAYREVMK
jgi:hypothetical protein